TGRRPGALFNKGTTSLSQTSDSGSRRRRPRGALFCDGSRGSCSMRKAGGALNPALAAATVGVSVWRKLIYSLIWQSVMWRPGKLRFLIGVKKPSPIRPAVTARKHGPLQGRAVARFATSVGLRPPFVTHPATLPHPDRRALFILFAAQQRPQPDR